MIVQPDRESRNVNEIFYENEARRIAELNEIFGEVELTAAERRTLVWLAGWEESTVVNVISAVRKAMAAEAKRQGLTPVRRTEKPSAERKGSLSCFVRYGNLPNNTLRQVNSWHFQPYKIIKRYRIE